MFQVSRSSCYPSPAKRKVRKCLINVNFILMFVSSFERRKEELESQSTSSRLRTMEFEEPEYENDTSEFCNSVMRNLEQSLETRFVWKIFKPLFRGKVSLFLFPLFLLNFFSDCLHA